MTAKELREKRAGLVYEMQDIMKQAKDNDGGKMTPEQEERWDKLEADEAELAKQIERSVRQEELDAEMAERAAKKEEPKKDPEKDYRDAYLYYLRTGRVKDVLQRGFVTRDSQDGQSVTTDADGGYTVPDIWAGQIETARKDFGGIYTIANVLATPDGRKMYMPTVNDTSNKSAILAEEEINTESKVTFGQKEIDAYVLATPIIPISLQLLQDSNYDIMNYIIGLMAERDARGVNYYATVGSGNSQPQGVVGASTKGEDAGATTIVKDNLYDLKHSVDVAYRQNAHWMLNDSTLKAIKKLSVGDADDRPLWQAGLAFGVPDTIDGDPYVINSDMADIGAENKSVLYGDFSKFMIRVVKGYQTVRFEEKYMNSLQKAIMGWSRMDSELLDAGTHPIKHILHAAS